LITVKENQKPVDYYKKLKNLWFWLSQPLVEIVSGILKDTIPFRPLIAWGIMFDIFILTKWDERLFGLAKAAWLYPTNPVAYTIYCVFGVTFGFWLWGVVQTKKRISTISRLTDAFSESGLKSPMGKLPNFIFDKPVDELVRKMRVTNAFMPKAKFEEAKDRIESALQIYIDDISESRSSGTIDFLYSHYEISKFVEFKNMSSVGTDQFFIGQTRARPIYGSLKETPHLLIGGQTGGGKSTFLRQLITTLYSVNRDYKFLLIDMKGGLEFQIFEKRKRVQMISNAESAKTHFDRLDEILQKRFEILKLNNCKDIEEFQRKPKADVKLPKDHSLENLDLSRQIVVIDEAAELFLSSGKVKVGQVQELNRVAIRLAAQGRAVGIHLIIATQKPDAKAVSTQIKANLTGIISFPMATLGASFSILGTGRAKELPAISGRAVWKSGLDQFEVQTPFLSTDETKVILDKISPPEFVNEKQ